MYYSIVMAGSWHTMDDDGIGCLYDLIDGAHLDNDSGLSLPPSHFD